MNYLQNSSHSVIACCRSLKAIPVMAVLAMATLPTSTFAAKGGGVSTPPPPSPYTVEAIPRAGWGNFRSADHMNINGDVAGEVYQTIAGITTDREGFSWKRGAAAVEVLPALRALGHTVSRPKGINADGSRIFGYSSPGAYQNAWPVMWVRQSGGGFTAIDLKDKVAVHLDTYFPLWKISSFHGHDGPGPVNFMSSGGEFIAVTGLSSLEWNNTTPEVCLIVRLNWQNPVSPEIARMWVIGALPNPDLGVPGFRGVMRAIREGSKGDEPVLYVAGTQSQGDFRPAMVAELNLTTFQMSMRTMMPTGEDRYRSMLMSDVNSMGEAIGSAVWNDEPNTRHFIWSPDGSYDFIPSLPGSTTRAVARGLNDAGQVVGINSTKNGVTAYLWNALDGSIPVDLNAVTGGTWKLSWARAINNKKEIITSSSSSQGQSLYLLKPKP